MADAARKPATVGASAARRALSAQRRQQALDLVLGGANYEQAGKALGISAQATWVHVQKALDEGIRKRIAEGAEKLRQIHHQRQEGIIMALWPKRADPKAATVVLAALAQQAKLQGLTVDEVLMRTQDESAPRAFDTSALSLEEKRNLRALLLKAAATPAMVEVKALEVPAEGPTNGHGSNGNGTHAMEVPSPEVMGDGEEP